MTIEDYNEAKKIFLHYNGSYFHMQREEYLDQYMKFNISKKEERKWLKEKVEKIKKYTEELILIKVLIYNKSARVNFKNNISLSVISDELNRKTIDNIIQNIDLDEVKLIDKLLLDEEISKKITEILSRDDNIFKSDMNIEEKDPMIVLKSFENRTLEERMKMIEKKIFWKDIRKKIGYSDWGLRLAIKNNNTEIIEKVEKIIRDF